MLGALVLAARHDHTSLSHVVTIFDGGYYRDIALHGYPKSLPVDAAGHARQSPIAFFPLFPLLVRAFMELTGLGFVGAALVVNSLVSAACGVVVFLVLRRVSDSETGAVAAALWLTWPISFVLSLAYAEALFVLLAALTLYLLLERRYVPAGLVAALCTATRPNGLVVALCCAAAFIVAAKRRESLVRPAIAVMLAPLGFVGFLGYLWQRTGHPDAWFRTESEGWHVHFDGGLSNVARVGRYVRDLRVDGLAVVVIIVVAVVLLVLAFRERLDPILLVYASGIVLLALTSSNDLSSTPRFAFAAFPLMLPLARLAVGRMKPAAIGAGVIGLMASAGVAGVILTTVSRYPP